MSNFWRSRPKQVSQHSAPAFPKTLLGHNSNAISCLTKTPQGFASADSHGRINCWDVSKGLTAPFLTYETKTPIRDMVFLPNNKLACCGDNGLVYILHINEQCVKKLFHQNSSVNTLMPISQDPNLLIFASDQLYLGNIASGKFKKFSETSATTRKLTALNKQCLVSTNQTNIISIWDLYYCELVTSHVGGEKSVCALLKFSDELFISGDTCGNIIVWNDLLSAEKFHIIKAHSDKITAISKISEKYFLTAGDDNNVKLWEAASGKCVSTTQVLAGVTSMVYLPKYDFLISGDRQGTIHICQLNQLTNVMLLTNNGLFSQNVKSKAENSDYVPWTRITPNV